MSFRALRSATTSGYAYSSISHLALALRNAHNIVRSLSTTAPSAAEIGPESPLYIEVPKPATRIPKWKTPQKGFVPKPRNVLKNSSNRFPKHSAEFLSRVAPEPTNEKKPPADIYGQEKMMYKSQLSATRRKNLREGILALHKRDQEEREKRRLIGERRQRERDEILARAAADDVKYTIPTMDRALTESFRPVDKYVNRRIARQKKKYAKLMFKYQKNKTELIHELYQNAHTFILTEQQLDEIILDRFPTPLDAKDYEARNRTILPTGLDLVKQPSLYTDQQRTAWLDAELAAALTGGKLAGELPDTDKKEKEKENALNSPGGSRSSPSNFGSLWSGVPI